MGGTLNGRKHSLTRLILEGKNTVLSELFDSKPFKTSFDIEPSFEYASYEIDSFKDPKSNEISIWFTEVEAEDVFDVEFSVNGTSFKAANADYNVKEYSELLSTVSAAVSQFLEEYNPYGLIFRGSDDFASLEKNPKKKGQKNRIYNFFIIQLKKNSNYKLGNYPDGIGLQRIN